MPNIIPQRQTKRRRGYALAEMPVGMLVLFLGIGFPMILGCAMSYKVFLVYFAVRDACIHASKCGSWTDNGSNLGVTSEANLVFTTDINAFNKNNQLVVTPPPTGLSVQVWQQPLASGTGSAITDHTTLKNADQTVNNYSLQVYYTGKIQPFLGKGWGGWMGNVWGLSAPLPLTICYQSYLESPKGLAN